MHFRRLEAKQGEKALSTISQLIKCVIDFKDDQDWRFAALRALRAVLNLFASREEHIRDDLRMKWPKTLIQKILEGLDDSKAEKSLQERLGSLLCCFQLIEISAAPRRQSLEKLDKIINELDVDTDWNPGIQNNKTEVFFQKVFKTESYLDSFGPKSDEEEEFTREREPFSRVTEDLLQKKFPELCRKLIRQRKSRYADRIHPVLLPLLPKLCAFDPKAFVTTPLNPNKPEEGTIFGEVIRYCLDEIEKGRTQRSTHQKSALLCLGLVINLVSMADLECLFTPQPGKKESEMELQLDRKIIPALKIVLSDAFVQKVAPGVKYRLDPSFFKCIELISNDIRELHDSLWSKEENREFIKQVIAFGLIEITVEWISAVQSLNENSSKEQISDGMEQILLKILFPSEKLPSHILHETSEDHACLSNMDILKPFKVNDRHDFGPQITDINCENFT